MVFSNSFTWENITSLPSCQLSRDNPDRHFVAGCLGKAPNQEGMPQQPRTTSSFPSWCIGPGAPSAVLRKKGPKTWFQMMGSHSFPSSTRVLNFLTSPCFFLTSADVQDGSPYQLKVGVKNPTYRVSITPFLQLRVSLNGGTPPKVLIILSRKKKHGCVVGGNPHHFEETPNWWSRLAVTWSVIRPWRGYVRTREAILVMAGGWGLLVVAFFFVFFGNTSFGKVVGLWREFLFSHLNFCVLKFLLVKLDSEANSIVVRCWFRLWAKFAGIKSEKDNFRNETHLCFFCQMESFGNWRWSKSNRTSHPNDSVLNPPSSFGFFFPVSLDRLAEMMENPWEMMTRIWTSYNNYMNWRPTCWRVSVDEANTPEVENMCEFWSINSHYFHIIGINSSTQ